MINCALYCNVSDVLFSMVNYVSNLIIFVNIVSSINTNIVSRVVNCIVSNVTSVSIKFIK